VRLSIPALVAAIGATAPALAQPEIPCGVDWSLAVMEMSIHHAYQTNASCCTGAAIALALAIDLGGGIELRTGDCGCPIPGTAIWVDSDSGTKTNNCVALSASTAGAYNGSASVDLDWCCTGGTTDVTAHSEIYTEAWSDSGGIPNPYCHLNFLGLGIGIAAGAKTFCYSGSAAWNSEIDIDASVDLSAWMNLADPHPIIIFVSEDLERGGNHGIRQGIYRFNSEGNDYRLGFFTDSTFDTTTSGNVISFSASGYGLASAVPSGSGDVTMTFKYDIIGKLDGNMNPEVDQGNPIVCYTDRAILYGLRGVSLGDPTYNPRCDLNLDGDITSADIAIFNTLPCNANWDCSTTAPVLNSNDFTAYMNSYAASDPVADVDGSGALNVADFTAFLNAYAVGCN
jgi:hypothetical protein